MLDNAANTVGWPAGDGQMARLIRAHDWGTTSLGPIAGWSQTLRISMDTILRFPVPMALLWGEKGILLYNDAYVAICGARHPQILGIPVAHAWPEAAEFNLSVLQRGLSGEACSFERMPFTLKRADQAEDLWFNLIYSPVVDETGDARGVMGVVIDITSQITAEQQREANQVELMAVEDRLRLTLGASELVGTWDWDMVNDRVIADERFAVLYGVDPVVAAKGAPIAEFVRSVHPDDQLLLQDAIDKMLAEGGAFVCEYRLLQKNGHTRWVVARGRLRYDADNHPVSFPGVAVDITERKQIEQLMDGQKRALELAITDAPLGDVLNVIANTIETQSGNPLHCALMVADSKGTALHKGAAPTLHPAVYDLLDGTLIGEGHGVCGLSAFIRQEIIVPDVTIDPLCKGFEDFLLTHNIRACWSTPLLASDNSLLGVCNVYYPKIGEPSAHDRKIIELMTRTAAIVIERQRDLAWRKTAEDRLRLLSDMDDATRNIDDPFAVMSVLTALIGKHFNVSRCAYADVENNQDDFYIRDDYVTDGLGSTIGVYRLDDFGMPAAQKMRDGETLVICNVSRELTPEEGASTFTDALGLQAIICCPLIKQDGLTAMMALHCRQPRQWTEEEITLFEAVAERSWSTIERARATARLRESEESFRQLANATPQVVWSARADGRIDYLNARSKAYSGEIPQENGIFQCAEFIHGDDLAASAQAWQHSVDTGQPYQVEQRIYYQPSAEYRWNLSLALAAHDDNGRVIRWYGTNTDIDDQKKFSAELAHARDAAEAANIAKSEFLANMSHEIRTPMNAIMGLAHILSNSTPLSDKQKHFLDTLQASADGLLILINDLLDIAKIEAGSIEFEAIPFNLHDVTQDIVSMLEMRAHDKNLQFIFDGECVRDRLFLGDPTRIRQIILNLCSNAIKFTEVGSVSINLTCHEDIDAEGKQTIEIEVKDTGIGIAKNRMADIFEKFVQADTSINRKYGGTGLGLAITKTLVAFMNGSITVDSVTGEGSTFTVTFDLEPVENISPRQNIQTHHDTTDTQGALVLLVEDYAPNVMVAGAYLDQFGYRYDVANSGLEALERIKSTAYDVILMDVQMHDMNGFEATIYIRDLENKKGQQRVPIIGMTAHAMVGDRERCIAAGMDDYMAKPFNPVALKAMLEHFTKIK